MRRIFAFLFLLVTSCPSWGQTLDQVDGDVNVRSHEPALVSVSDKARFFPGHRLVIAVSGQIDVNPDEHNDCNKDALGFCHRSYWTDHHYHSPDTVPAYFVLRRADGQGQKIEFTVGVSPVSKDIPVDGATFDKPYELLGYIAAPGTGIDPGRSTNTYKVTISVDATQRVNNLPAYFAAQKPIYADFKDARNNRQVIDRYSEAQFASRCAQFIRSYAVGQFQVAQGGTAQENLLSFLQRAKQLAPLDGANTQALVNFYNSVGLPQQAEKELNQTITSLEKQVQTGDAAKDKANLANLYITLASTIAENSGSVDPAALERADGIYAKAADVLGSINFVDRRANTLSARASLLRRLRSLSSLKSAISLYEQAKGQMALTVVGDIALRSVDGKTILAGPNFSGYRAVNIQTGDTVASFTRSGRDFRPVAWDPIQRRVLMQAGDTLAWHDPFSNSEPESTISAIGDSFHAAAGAFITSTSFDGRTLVVTKGGADHKLSIAGEDGCSFNPVSAPAPPQNRYGPAALSLDGITVAIYCGVKIGVSKASDDQLRSAAVIDVSKIDGKPRDILGVALSPDGRSLAAITRSAPPPALPPPGGPVPTYDDRVLVWDGLETGGHLSKEVPLASELISPRFGFVIAPPALSFTPDGASLVLSNGKHLVFFTIATGQSQTVSIASPTAALPPPVLSIGNAFFPTPALTMELTSQDDFIIKDPAGAKIVLVSWPSRSLTRISIGSESAGALVFGTIVTRNTANGREIVWIGEREFLSLNQQISPDNAQTKAFATPESLDTAVLSAPPLLLAGGKFVVSREWLASQTTVTEIGVRHKTLVLPEANYRAFVVGLTKANTWARIVTAADSRTLSIDLFCTSCLKEKARLPRAARRPNLPFQRARYGASNRAS